jgi:hypothetical protein
MPRLALATLRQDDAPPTVRPVDDDKGRSAR